MNVVMSSAPSLASTNRLGPAIRWASTVVLALSLCAVPLWLWAVPLRWFELKSDDFVYLARSRSTASLRNHLIVPHNGHVVPLFLLETHLLARAAGSLEAVPTVMSWATYATLVLSMALAGHLVAWETGRAAHGLAAMAAVGFTSVMGTALLWYSAGQALASGTMILAMLAALQAWRARGSWWLLVLAALAAMAAPLFWTAGYIAGLAGAAYLWADGRRSVPAGGGTSPFGLGGDLSRRPRDCARILKTASEHSEPPLRMVLGVGPA